MIENIIVGIAHAIEVGQLRVCEIFVDMDGRLTPVRGAPRYVDTRAECIVGKQFIKVIAVFRFKDGLGAGCSVGGARSRLIHLQFLLFRQQWIGVTLVTVELEIGFSCRLTDDEHHHSLLIICNLTVGQFDFLCLLVLTETNDAICICDVRPGLHQSSQFGVVLTDEQRLVNIQ